MLVIPGHYSRCDRAGLMEHVSIFFGLLLAGMAYADIPFPIALHNAAVNQSLMAAEIPGSLILGNGDLNGILWRHHGSLLFSITKKTDPRLPICGNVGFIETKATNSGCLRGTCWLENTEASLRYDADTKKAVATINGKAGMYHCASWSFEPNVGGDRRYVLAEISGTTNAEWWLDFPGTGVTSGWRAAKPGVAEVKCEIPAGKKLTRIDFSIRAFGNKTAEVRLHSMRIGGEMQSLAGLNSVIPAGYDARLDIARAVASLNHSNGHKLTARVLAHRNVAIFETQAKVTLTPCPAKSIPPSTRGTDDGVEWVRTQVPGEKDRPGMSFALVHAANDARHAVAVVTSLEAKDPVAAAVKLAGDALAEDAAKQIAAHEAVWREYWSTSGVALADGYLEATWYRNLYFLRCYSKSGVPPLPVFAENQVKAGEVNWWPPAGEKEKFARTIRNIHATGSNSVQVAAAGSVSELLMQSEDAPSTGSGQGMIRIFPAWPKRKDANFVNLRAQGGFLVSAEQKAGQIVKLEITATVGGKLRIVNPWTEKLVERDLAAGETFRMHP